MRLALLSIMLNEAPLVPRWALNAPIEPWIFDEVVVIDGDSTDGTVEALLDVNIRAIVRPFPDDFSDQRNFGIDQTEADWIFEVDADEMISRSLLRAVHRIIDQADADGVDCIGIPRLNFHDGALQASPGYLGLDYQYRLHRRYVRWHKPVHEEVTGFTRRVELDFANEHFLLHMKTAARHEERNAVYRRLAEGVG